MCYNRASSGAGQPEDHPDVNDVGPVDAPQFAGIFIPHFPMTMGGLTALDGVIQFVYNTDNDELLNQLLSLRAAMLLVLGVGL